MSVWMGIEYFGVYGRVAAQRLDVWQSYILREYRKHFSHDAEPKTTEDYENLARALRDLHDLRNNTVEGNFSDEDEIKKDFMHIMKVLGAFDARPEVTATKMPELPHWRTDKQRMRVDFLCLPTQKLIDAGWPEGQSVIVECKRSGTPIGPAISQLMDYMGCEFTVDGNLIRPSWGLVYRVSTQHNAIASVMSHQRIGTISVDDYWKQVTLLCGQSRLATLTKESISVRQQTFQHGKRSGSR